MDLSLPNRQRARDASLESPVKSSDESPTDTPTRRRKRKSSEPKKRLTDFSIKRLCFDDSPRSSPARSTPDVQAFQDVYHVKLDEEGSRTPSDGSPTSDKPKLPIYQDISPTPGFIPPLFTIPPPYASLLGKDTAPLHPHLPYPLGLLPYPPYPLLPAMFPGLPFPLPSPTAFPPNLNLSPTGLSLLTPGRGRAYHDEVSPSASVTDAKEASIKEERAATPQTPGDQNDERSTIALDFSINKHKPPAFQDERSSPPPPKSVPQTSRKSNTAASNKAPVIIRNGTVFPFTADSAVFAPLSPTVSQHSPAKAFNDSPQSCNASTSGSLSPGSASSQGGSAGDGGDKRSRKNYKNMTRERRVEANARERSRVHTISAAFEELRKVVPTYSNNQKLSKLAILRIACSYILALARLAGYDYSIDQSGMSFEECVELCSSTIQNETKPKRR